MIDPNFWASEDVSKLSHFERLMLIGLFSAADDYGKGRANAAYIRSSIFSYEDIPLKEIEKALCNIQKHIEIIIYQNGDGKYYKFTNWRKWQKVDHPTDSIIPDLQDSEIILDNFAIDSRINAAEIPTNINKDNISKDKKNIKKEEYTSEFEIFYKTYPRPEDKHRTFTNWKSQLKQYSVEQLMIATRNYNTVKAGTEIQFIKSSANFLGRDKIFEDYLVEEGNVSGRNSKDYRKNTTSGTEREQSKFNFDKSKFLAPG